MGYAVRFLDSAERDVAGLDEAVVRRILDRLAWLAENLGYVRMEVLHSDLAGFYKLRVGNYRIVYEVLHEERVIIVHMVGHRREIYRRR